MASLNIILFWSSLIRRKTDWSESKKETKLVAMRNKKRKRPPQIVLTGPKRARNFLNLLKFVKMFKKNLVSFEPTTFSLRLTLFLPKTNSHSNRFFLKLNSIDNSQKKKSENFNLQSFHSMQIFIQTVLNSLLEHSLHCCCDHTHSLRNTHRVFGFELLED